MAKKQNNVTFICAFRNYEKEKSGKKRNHVVDTFSVACAKSDRLIAFRDEGIPCTITLRKGYTKEYFIRNITDVTHWDLRLIISW